MIVLDVDEGSKEGIELFWKTDPFLILFDLERVAVTSLTKTTIVCDDGGKPKQYNGQDMMWYGGLRLRYYTY